MRNASKSIFAVLTLALVSTACGSPGWVDGVVEDQPFEIRDNMPAARESSPGTMLVVLSQEDGETLRVTSIHIPSYETVETGTPLAFAETQEKGPVLSISEGDLEIYERSDGAQILSSNNNRFAHIESGTLVLDAVDDNMIAGTFKAVLAGGGHVEGSFAVER